MDGPFHGAGDCDAGVLLKSLIRPDETTGDEKTGDRHVINWSKILVCTS